MLAATALILDATIGEPRWLWSRLPHPVVLIGRAIDLTDKQFNKGHNRRLKGVIVVVLLLIGSIAIGFGISVLPFGWVFEILIAAILLAQRSLVDHVKAVVDALDISVENGRIAVSMIVGRDTASMDESAVARAAIESAAENLSDGVVAPLFWFALAGLPGILCYKAINTADSMIGYLTPRHAEFGWAAARFDDLLNWLPARLTAVLLLFAGLEFSNLAEIAKDATKHRSPNAGWPEAAAARVLNIALSGPRSYEGRIEDHLFVNAQGQKSLKSRHIRQMVGLLWKVWGILLVGGLIAGVINFIV